MVGESSEPVFEACPACGAQVDVSECMPLETVSCPACNVTIRARAVFDHYGIQEMRGVGGMSQVFVARDKNLNRLVALKVLNRENSSKQERIGQFEREAKLTASINHPNVVRVYGVGHAQGNFYIAMELVDGSSLEEMLHQHGKLSEGQTLDLAIQTVEGLNSAYRIGLIHRDIKPGNILLTSEGKGKLVDFGLALVFETDVDDSDEIWATPYYVPPEKLDGQTEDFRSDIYSLGATLFHLLAGQPMYDTQTASIDELREIKTRPVRLGAYAPMVSGPTQEVVNQMINNNKEERFDSYDDLLQALNHARESLRDSLGKVGQVTREARRRAGRKRTVAHVAVLGAIIAALVVGLTVWHMNHEKALQNGNKIGTEDPSTDWDVGTLQGGNVSERFLQARQSMREGRYDEARRDFLDLSRDNRTRQPTVNWAAYSAALSDLLAGEPGRARETILQMKENPRFLTGPLGHAGPFFKDLADLMLTPWPIPDGELKKMRKHRAWQAGALMIGLKNWEHGRFKSAKFWLDAVQNSKVPGQLRWIEDLSPLFNHYRLDAGTLMSLNTVDDFVKSSDVEIALSEAQTALPKLRTKGRARRWLEARVVSLEKQRDTLATEEARQLAENMAARRVAEMQEISELQGKLELLRTGYQFAEGINEIEALHPLSAEAQSAQSLLLWYWKGAENYLKTLITDITEHGYKGNIRPKAGPVVYRGVSISKATRTSFVVEGSIGVVTIAISKMDAEQLLSLGYSMLEKVQGEKAVMERRRLLALFARQVGETERADSFADALKEDKEFSKSWNDLSAMEAGVTPSSDSGL